MAEDSNSTSEYERRYRALVENSNDIIYCHDLEGNYTFINEAGQNLTGYSYAEAIKLNAVQVVAPEYQDLIFEMIKNKVANHGRSFYEIEIITKDGLRLPLEVSTHLIYDGVKPVGVQGIARDITLRRQREAVLVESEQKYRQLVNEATDIIYRTDLSGHFTFINPVAGKAMERPDTELLGMHFLELIREDYRSRAAEFYGRQVTDKIRNTYYEFPAITGTGKEVWIGQNVQLLLKQGKPAELQAVARNITDLKRIEIRLKESETRYRSLFNVSPNPIWVYDRESLDIIAVNKAVIHTYDFSQQELLSMKISDVLNAADLELLNNALAGDPRSHHTLIGTRKILRKNRPPLDVELTFYAVTLGGRMTVIVIATDVTERLRAEAERQVMLDVIQSVSLTEDLDALLKFIHASLKKVLYAENCFVALYNFETGLFDKPFFVDTSSSARPASEMKRSCTAYVFRMGEPSLITPDNFQSLIEQGEIQLVGENSKSWLGVPLKTSAKTIGVLAVQHYEDPDAYDQRDVQFLSSVGGQIAMAIERKRSEEMLRVSEERFSKAFNFTPLSMSLVSISDLRIIDVNNSFLSLGGYDRSQVIGRNAMDLQLWGDRETTANFIDKLKTQHSIKGLETQVALENGSVRVCLTSAETINLHGEQCVLSVTTDITEHRALEEQLRQSQRMEAIGQLAGGVAHDFNNVLTAITGYSELSLRRLGINHPVSKNIEQIQKAGSRAAGLTRQLLAFSRRQLLQAKIFDLNVLVSEMNQMLERLIGEDIQLNTVLKPGSAKVKADPGQIEQILLNLIVNARDAMEKGGDLTIETDVVELDEHYADKRVSIVPGQYVLLAVSDTGVGMDQATQQRIFEPFFTTKEVGKGTGLGLSTVYGIVKQSNGYIWVYSETGKGTTFKVYLPSVDTNEVEEMETTKIEIPRGDETILVVEDEEQLRALVKMILEESGYKVREATNGVEGLRLCNESSEHIDLMITDVVMPFMSGREMAEQVVNVRPQIKILYMSGYTDDSVVRHGVLEDHVFFLQKPFTPTALATKVRDVLNTPLAR